MRRVTAGLLAHQSELQAVTHPTINDYKRSVDYSFAPTQITWGVDNRHAGVRCLPGIGAASRIEVRWASAATNPYSVAQGYLQAALHGLVDDLPLIDECVGDSYADPRWERIADRPDIALRDSAPATSPTALSARRSSRPSTLCRPTKPRSSPTTSPTGSSSGTDRTSEDPCATAD